MPRVKLCIKSWGKKNETHFLKALIPVREPATRSSYQNLGQKVMWSVLFCAVESRVWRLQKSVHGEGDRLFLEKEQRKHRRLFKCVSTKFLGGEGEGWRRWERVLSRSSVLRDRSKELGRKEISEFGCGLIKSRVLKAMLTQSPLWFGHQVFYIGKKQHYFGARRSE